MCRSLINSFGVATPTRQKETRSKAGSLGRSLYMPRIATKKSSEYGSFRVLSISSMMIMTSPVARAATSSWKNAIRRWFAVAAVQ